MIRGRQCCSIRLFAVCALISKWLPCEAEPAWWCSLCLFALHREWGLAFRNIQGGSYPSKSNRPCERNLLSRCQCLTWLHRWEHTPIQCCCIILFQTPYPPLRTDWCCCSHNQRHRTYALSRRMYRKIGERRCSGWFQHLSKLRFYPVLLRRVLKPFGYPIACCKSRCTKHDTSLFSA